MKQVFSYFSEAINSITSLPYSMRARDDVDMDPVTAMTHPCQFCVSTFVSAQQLCEHMSTHRLNTPYDSELLQVDRGMCKKAIVDCSTTLNTQCQLTNHTAICSTRKFTCFTCGMGFTDQYLLKAHINEHADEEAINKCFRCKIRFKTLSELKSHICGERFNYLKMTNKSVRLMRSSLCSGPEDCDSLQNQTYRDLPRESHSSSRTLVSMICTCNKRFMTLDEIRTHIGTCKHPEGESFKCELCNVLLTEGSVLQHIASGTFEQLPSERQMGDESFHDACKLNSHMCTDSTRDIIHCSDCNQQFTFKQDLVNHKKGICSRSERFDGTTVNGDERKSSVVTHTCLTCNKMVHLFRSTENASV